MKSKLVFIVVLLIVFHNAFSQSWQLGLGSGAWVHSQKTLKSFNESIISTIPFEVGVTENFPTSPFFQVEAGYTFEQLYIGFIYTYNSTGSRITSSDYSGTYYYDIILTGHIPGISIGYCQRINDKLKLYYKSDFGEIFSILKMNETIMVKNVDSNEEKTNLVATSFYAKPNLQLSYELNKIRFYLSLGYLIDFKAPFHLKNQKKAILSNPSTREEVKSSWNGLMAGISVYYTVFSNILE